MPGASEPLPRVLVDPYLDVPRLRTELAALPLTVDELDGDLAGEDVVAVVSWRHRVGDAELARLPALRALVTPSVGFDHFDLDAARRHGGVHVCHVPDYCLEEMADSALALALALVRGIVALDRSVRAGEWSERAAGPLRRVRGTRLGVVGFGRIGAAVARRAMAIGFEVLAADPVVAPATIAQSGATPVSLDALLGACDVVSLHVPLTPQTRGLIGPEQIARMRRGSMLVNTARGDLVDTDAVVDGLRGGHLGGAALDVLSVEPPTLEHPAPRVDNLIVTPHAAYYSVEAEAELYRRTGEAIRAALAGRRPPGALVTPGEPA